MMMLQIIQSEDETPQSGMVNLMCRATTPQFHVGVSPAFTDDNGRNFSG
jgi:hypothetical protein